MSASMNTIFPSRREVNATIIANTIFSTILFAVILLTFGTALKLDLIANVLPATKLYAFFIVLFHIGYGLFACVTEKNYSRKVKMSSIVTSVVLISFSAALYHIIAVLFGAPLLQSVAQTFHFAMIMTACTAVPAFMCLGCNSESWTRVFLLHSPDIGRESTVHLTVIFSIIGAWISAAPIPLDWDRPWQVWPITCVVGCIIGHNLGLLFSSAQLYYKYRESRKFKLT